MWRIREEIYNDSFFFFDTIMLVFFLFLGFVAFIEVNVLLCGFDYLEIWVKKV